MTDYGTLLRDHVTLRCRSIDRIFLQAYVPRLQAVGDVCTFLRWQRKYIMQEQSQYTLGTKCLAPPAPRCVDSTPAGASRFLRLPVRADRNRMIRRSDHNSSDSQFCRHLHPLRPSRSAEGRLAGLWPGCRGDALLPSGPDQSVKRDPLAAGLDLPYRRARQSLRGHANHGGKRPLPVDAE